MRIIFCILLLCCLLSGCWDYAPLEDKYIVTGIGIDISEQDPMNMDISVLGISNIQANATMHGEGRTVSDALRSIQNRIDKAVLISHLKIVLISDRIAKKGIQTYLDILSRNSQIRSDTQIALVHGRAADYFVQKNFSIPIDASYYSDTFQLSETIVDPHEFFLNSILFRLSEDGKGFAIPYLRWDPKQKLLVWSGIGLFNNGFFKDTLDERETVAYYLIKGSLSRAMITIGRSSPQLPKAQAVSIRIFSPSRKLSWSDQNGVKTINLSIQLKDEIIEASPLNNRPITSQELEHLQNDVNHDLTHLLHSVMDKIQKTDRMDPFGFQEKARVQWPNWYQGDHWNEQFSAVKWKFDVQILIERFGKFI